MNQAQEIQRERSIESLLEDERPTFEQFTYRRYLAERQSRTMVLDTAMPVSIQGLCWKNNDGSYGVERINHAWLGWKARAMYQILMTQATQPADGGTDDVVG